VFDFDKEWMYSVVRSREEEQLQGDIGVGDTVPQKGSKAVGRSVTEQVTSTVWDNVIPVGRVAAIDRLDHTTNTSASSSSSSTTGDNKTKHVVVATVNMLSVSQYGDCN
jgi:hypothetical protein